MVTSLFKKINKIPFLNYFFYIVLLLIAPDKLAEIDKEICLEKEFETNQGFKDKKDNGNFIKKISVDFKHTSLGRIRELRKASKKAFIIVISIFASSFFAAFLYLKYFGLPSQNAFFLTRLLSLFFVLFGIYATAGRSIHSIGGETVPENLDAFLCKILPSLGVWVILLMYFIEYLTK